MIRPARMLDPVATAIINRYQGGVPLSLTPYADIAASIRCSEAEVITCINKLLEGRWLTRFGPLYDAVALGGGLTLAAVSVPEPQYDMVVDIINEHPQVAHNYRREHQLNMWFVIATETPQEITATINDIERQTGLEVFDFPKQHEFYVGLQLDVTDDRVRTVPVSHQREHTTAYTAEPVDKAIIQHTQAGLPVTPEPWATLAQQIDTDCSILIGRVQHMLDCGVIRRIGAVPNHYKLGLRANGMSVWDVDDASIIALGERIGALDFVSHCYQRPRHLPGWRYNLFAMVHGHDHDEVESKVECIAGILGDSCHDHAILYSSRILKKTGLRLAA